MDMGGFVSCCINSEPGKELRLTPSLASRVEGTYDLWGLDLEVGIDRGGLVKHSLAIDAEGQPKRAGRGGFEF